jgi:transcriptional regulator with XRE-family HTH domain
MTIGERIKNIRIERGLTQEDLAKRMGYKTRSAICQVERNGDNITSDRIAAFAEALGVSIQTLMGWEEPAPSASAMDIARAFEEADVMTQEMVKRLLGYKEEFEKMIKGAKGEP